MENEKTNRTVGAKPDSKSGIAAKMCTIWTRTHGTESPKFREEADLEIPHVLEESEYVERAEFEWLFWKSR